MACEFCDQLVAEGISEQMAGYVGAGVIAAIFAVGIVIALLFIAALYVYSSLAWYTIAKKLKYKSAWLAWIPVVNVVLVLELGGFHWAWIFLLLLPVVGWLALFVLVIIATWRICVKRKYPGWFSLSMLIPNVGGILYLVVIGLLAWGKK